MTKMKYLSLIIKLLKFSMIHSKTLVYVAYTTLMVLVVPITFVTAADYSKEELKSATEVNLRAAQSRNNRLQKNELLDPNSRFYYDGNDLYPGIILDKLIFPALVNGSRRVPGCIYNGQVIPGDYRKLRKEVVCDISDYPQQGKSFTIGEQVVADNSGISDKYQQQSTSKSPARTAVKKSKRKPAKLSQKAIRTRRPTIKAKSSATRSSAPKNSVTSGSVLEVNGFRTNPLFGVRAGTWASIMLPRAVSSSEIADIEMELIEDIQGIHKKIPAGTIFFASHTINPSTQRLDMRVTLMVLPDGSEYQVTATIHSISRTSGLAGSVIAHSDKVASIAARKGFWETSKASLAQEASPVGRLAGNVAREVLDSQSRALPQAPEYSVQVAAQEGLIRFGRSF